MKKEKKRYKSLIILIIMVAIIMLFSVLGVVLFYYNSTKDVSLNDNLLKTRNYKIKIIDKNNENIFTISNKYTTYKDFPKDLVNAFVSIEDKRFFKHNGIDYYRICGAIVNNIKEGKIKEGASTISQQLIKNTHLTSEKTYKRKLKEIKLTRELEKKYSKEQIMEMYLNEIYFGNGIYGIGSASSFYFNKDTKDLTLNECAILAGIVKNPSKYSLTDKNLVNCRQRRDIVLKSCLNNNYINENSYKLETNIELFIDNKLNYNSFEYIKNDIIAEINENIDSNIFKNIDADIQIYTYIDKELCSSMLEKIKDDSILSTVSIITDNFNGGIIGYVNNTNESIFKIKRQVGSTLKPFATYLPSINELKYTSLTPLLDEKIEIGSYIPKNYSNSFSGWMSMEDCLAKSINIPSIKLIQSISPEVSLNYVNKFKISTCNEDNNIALALGSTKYGINPLELVAGYSVFANYGIYIRPTFVKKIYKDNKLIYSHIPQKEKIITSGQAFMITEMLKKTVTKGTAIKLSSLNYEIASKTGTYGISENTNNDAYNISYTTDNTLLVWQGTKDYKEYPTKNFTGGGAPTILAREIYKNIYDKSLPQVFQIPNDIIKVKVDKHILDVEHRIVISSNGELEMFIEKENYDFYEKLIINSNDIDNKFNIIQFKKNFKYKFYKKYPIGVKFKIKEYFPKENIEQYFNKKNIQIIEEDILTGENKVVYNE